MLTPSDLLHLPYAPDLTEGGIAYACRSLAYTYDRMGGSLLDRLRRIVGGVAVELAFRRHLTEQGIPFDVLGATPFTDPDRYDVSLGGHRCDLKSFLITRREQIGALRKDPAQVLQAAALVPLDQFASSQHSEQDIYLFAFFSALTTPSRGDFRKAMEAGQPVYLIHPLPDTWARPRFWQPLAPLALKSEADEALTVELGGQDASREFLTITVELPPRQRVQVEADFHAIAHLHVSRLPEARIGIHSPLRGEPYLIQPHEWGNIWVYGMSIILTGYLSREEFRRRAEVLPVGSRVFQYSQTRTKNLSVPVTELKPLGNLFERVRKWGSKKQEPGS